MCSDFGNALKMLIYVLKNTPTMKLEALLAVLTLGSNGELFGILVLCFKS